MPQEITKEDGSKETVYTAEELEAAAKSEAEKATAPLQQQLSTAQTDLAKAKEDLAKADDKDKNFTALRDKVTKLETLNADLGNQIKTATESAVLGVQVQNAIASLADGDQNVKDKIALKYAELAAAKPPKTEAEAAKLVRDAYSIATQKESQGPDTLGAVVSSAGGGPTLRPPTAGADATLNDTQRKVGGVLGVSEEDAKKYPPGSVPTQTIKKT